MMKKFIFLLAGALLIIPTTVSGQDIIFKTNGETIKARILSKSTLSRSYRLFDHPDSITYFLKTALIDSIHYQNGVKEIFDRRSVPSTPETPEILYEVNHHLIGADVWGFLIYQNLTFSYELLPGNAHVGFKLSYSRSMDSWPTYQDDYFSLNHNALWYGSLGMNYYFFPPGTFRVGTGLRYVTGKYEIQIYEYENQTPLEYKERRNINGMMFSLFGFYNVHKNLAVNLGFDAPVAMKPKNSATVIRCELLLNF